MAWTLVGELAFTVSEGAGTEDKTLPGSPVEGDVVIVMLAGDNAIGTDSGSGIVTSGYDRFLLSSDNSPGRQAGLKVLGSTPDTVVTLDQPTAGLKPYAGLLQVWRGVDTGTPIDDTPTSATGGTGAPDAPSFATVTDGALRVLLGFLDDDDSAGASSAPSGYTDFLASDTGGSTGATVMIASKVATTAGAEDPGAFTSTSDAWAAVHFALRPAAGGGSEDALLANDVESDSEVSSPAIGQAHVLNATDVQSTSNVTAPALGQVHALAATDVESDSEVSAPAVGQAHVLAAADVESTSEVTAPAIGQIHVLGANDNEATSEVTAPAIGQVHALNATDAESASEVSAPALAVEGEDALLANDVEAQSELSSPALGQVHALLANDVESASVVSSPAINGARNSRGGWGQGARRLYRYHPGRQDVTAIVNRLAKPKTQKKKRRPVAADIETAAYEVLGFFAPPPQPVQAVVGAAVAQLLDLVREDAARPVLRKTVTVMLQDAKRLAAEQEDEDDIELLLLAA